MCDMHQLPIDLNCAQLCLLSPSVDIFTEWHKCFEPWTSPSVSTPIQVEVEITSTRPSTPTSAQFYDPEQQLSVQEDGDAWVLTFEKLATIRVEPKQAISRAQIGTAVLHNGRLQDITYAALAPHLRRCGIYLIHACGVVKDGRSVLIVGPSGSGKTTAGLSLLQDGWQLLGNDVIMLSEQDGTMLAWPTPGDVRLRSKTVALLDGLENGRFPPPQFAPKPAQVTHILFPTIATDQPTRLTQSVKAIALARLMAESIDCWDKTMVKPQVALLRRLCVQTAVYDLQSGHNISQLPHLLPLIP